MPRLRNLLFVLATVVLPASSFAGDLDSLQGSWETNFRQNERTYRAVKTIKGQTETVEVFDGEKLMKKHSVDFELDECDGIKTFTYRNGRVTFGAGAPTKLPDGKYIYRLDKDSWIGVFGALSTDSGPVYLQTFKRVVDDKAFDTK